jgi:2-polyprenyl-6-methoxyphenol hydroxylase-like FAD-dependent oxidoreductase
MTPDRAATQVIIVGAGPAGLALAVELGSRGISCLVVEKNDRSGVAPRAKLTNVRTAEHLRRWGLSGQLAEAAPFGSDYPSNILFVTALGGRLIARFDDAFASKPEADQRYSAHAQWLPQYKLEAVLLEYARKLPSVDIEFGTELIDFTDDGESVRARLKNVADGSESNVTASYLVGADGARSVVRERIAAKMVGTFGLSRNFNVVFEAPGLDKAHPHGPAVIIWQLNPQAPSVIGPMDVGDRWYFMPVGVSAEANYTDQEMADLIRLATGIDLPYRILSSDVWTASRLLADRYSRGRAFLVGDACHLHPPYGGYGMNMGIADSVDLGWKLAAVLQGWGGEALLDSYEAERRPVHSYVMDEAQANHALSPFGLAREGIADDTEEGAAVRAELAELIGQAKRSEFYSLGVVLGYRYVDSPIIADDPRKTIWRQSHDYVPSAEPGCLAPHRWLADGSSLYDHFGRGFTLLLLDPARRAAAVKAEEAARRLGIPLKIVETDDPAVVELYGAPLALIRPDQHVAWRGLAIDADLLAHVTARVAAEVEHAS